MEKDDSKLGVVSVYRASISILSDIPLRSDVRHTNRIQKLYPDAWCHGKPMGRIRSFHPFLQFLLFLGFTMEYP